jgi:hypothetical protein
MKKELNREIEKGNLVVVYKIGSLKTTIEKLFFYSILFQMLPNF